MRSSPARSLFVACGVLVLTNGPVFYVANRVLDNGMSWEEPFTRTVFAALAIASCALVVLDRHRLDGARLASPSPVAAAAIVMFSGWLVASSLWSVTPELTRGRALIYVGLAAFAWVVADLEFDQFRRALLLAVTVAVVASLLAVLLSDSIGADFNGDWRGIFTNRNSLAPVAGLAILLGISLAADRSGRARVLAAAIAVAGAVAMFGSGSRTASLALAAAGGAAGLVVGARLAARRGVRVGLPAFVVGSCGAAATFVAIAGLWGEATFVQRRTIWSLVWDRIGERPLHGYGWFNVWGDAEFTAADPLLARGSAHGSFLEVWLGVGLVGLVPFLVIVALALHRTLTDAWSRPSVASWTWLALVLFLVIENLTESFVLWFSYNWVLLMAAALRSDVGRRSPRAPQRHEASEAAIG